MAGRQLLKKTIDFTLNPGQTLVVPHELESPAFIPRRPDTIFVRRRAVGLNNGAINNVEVEADEINLFLTNKGPEATDGSVLVEYWHTIERAFGDQDQQDLPVKPFIVVSSEGDGQPPIPPFDPETFTIYARLTGNDVSGRGTLSKPYRTFQRAVRDVPPIVAPGNVYIVDVTGIGVETLPDNYELPTWITSRVSDDAITITAEHKLASSLTVALATINAGVINTDPVTNQFSIADVTKTWVTDALKGLFVYGTNDDGDPQLVAVIHHNTPTEIFVTSDEGGDFTFPFTIRECSAELRGQGVDIDLGGALTVNAPHEITIFGISIVPIDPDESAGFVQEGGLIWFIGCNLVNPFLEQPWNRLRLVACNIVAPFIAGPTYLRSSRVIDAGGGWLELASNEALTIFGGTVLDNCATITVTEFASLGGNLSLNDTLIKNAAGDAIYWPSGTAFISSVRINDSVAGETPGNAFTGQGGLYAKFDQVAGTGNAGVGIRVLDGAQVQITATVTVTGSADQQVGNFLAAPYPAVPFNINDIGVPGTNAGGATGTNARLFANP